MCIEDDVRYIDGRLEGVRGAVDDIVDRDIPELDSRIDKLDNRIDKLENKLDEQSQALEERLAALESKQATSGTFESILPGLRLGLKATRVFWNQRHIQLPSKNMSAHQALMIDGVNALRLPFSPTRDDLSATDWRLLP